jgi:integrase
MRLTDATVRGITLPAGKTDCIFFDEQTSGFGLRVRMTSKGLSRHFILQYRDDLGATRRYIIGPSAEINTVKARAVAADKLHGIRHGAFPHQERRARRAAAEVARDRDRETFGILAERFLKFQASKVSPRWFAEVARHVGQAWAPLHRVPIHAIGRRDIALRLGEITEASGKVPANHARSTLSAFFVWAQREGLVEANPTLNTYKHEVRARDRVLSNSELAAIWGACDDDDFGRIVRLLMLTAQRRTEVGGLCWSEIGEDGMWTLPAARSKNRDKHSIPLVPQALALLPPRRTGDHVFGCGFANWSRGKLDLDARLAGIAAWTLHDLRRSAATHMAELGAAPHIVETVLNHRKPGVAAVYNHARYAGEVRQALLLWADHLEAIVTGRDRKVVSLRQAG